MEFQGRTVTNRGVHLVPSAYHDPWLSDSSYWTDLLLEMHMSWAVIITNGDSAYDAAKVLLDAGIIPLIRDSTTELPSPYNNLDNVRYFVSLYKNYKVVVNGVEVPLVPYFTLWNEPLDDREWRNRNVPKNAWEIFVGLWKQAAVDVYYAGAMPGFPDGPTYAWNPFEWLKDVKWLFEKGAFYSCHNYAKGRPWLYPADEVSQNRLPLTEEAYTRMLDDIHWYRGETIQQINAQRASWNLYNADDTCYRGYLKTMFDADEAFGFQVPMCLMEGGWTPDDRAGSGPNTDYRWPRTTPKGVASKTLQMFEMPSPFFAICPWLLADEDMGHGGWPYDVWHGWAFSDLYGQRKPVIDTLAQNPPGTAFPFYMDLNGDIVDRAWFVENYGPLPPEDEGLLLVHEAKHNAVVAIDHQGFFAEKIGTPWPSDGPHRIELVYLSDENLSPFEEEEEEPPTVEGIQYFDMQGNELSIEQFKAIMGDVRVVSSGGEKFEVKSLRIGGPYTACLVTVLDKDGNIIPGKKVVWYYSTAPEAPGAGWENRGEVAGAKENGKAEFGQGSGSYYSPPDGGPHQVWLWGVGESQKVVGLGMLRFTEHTHTDIVFQEVGEEVPPPPPPEPPPPDDRLEDAVYALIDARDVMEHLLDELEDARDNITAVLDEICQG